MKEHITPKQALEVSEEQFYSLFKEVVKRDDWYKYHHKKVTVGKMIEFLVPVSMHCFPMGESWDVRLQGGMHRSRIGLSSMSFPADELVDALWEAVKSVLNSDGIVI